MRCGLQFHNLPDSKRAEIESFLDSLAPGRAVDRPSHVFDNAAGMEE
jgi:hypothetical protein